MIIANTVAIAQKELQGYFASPLSYLVLAIFWLISGLFFVEILLGAQGIIQQVTMSEQSGIPTDSIDVAYVFLNSFLQLWGLFAYLYYQYYLWDYTQRRESGEL